MSPSSLGQFNRAGRALVREQTRMQLQRGGYRSATELGAGITAFSEAHIENLKVPLGQSCRQPSPPSAGSASEPNLVYRTLYSGEQLARHLGGPPLTEAAFGFGIVTAERV